MNRTRYELIAGLVAVSLFSSSIPAEEQKVAPTTTPQPADIQAPPTVISIDARKVTLPEFENALRMAMRQKFYHGKVPTEQLISLQKEIADQIINRTLLLDEARRRGIQPDRTKIEQAIRNLDERYRGNPNYEKNREQALAGITRQMEETDLLDRLEKTTRDVAVPTVDEARAFYESRKELFTEPEKWKVSMILLGVEPSATQPVWDKAREEALGVYKNLKDGADFAEIAKLKSSDKTAAQGGSMGYLHRGMLTPQVESQLDKVKAGEIIEPVTLLEGEGIFRLDERVPAALRQFDDVKERARDLLKRDRSERVWKDLIEKLRAASKIMVDESRFAEIGARLTR